MARSLAWLSPSNVLAVALAACLGACGTTEVTVDGGAPLDAGPSGLLSLESEPSLALTVSGTAPVRVRYTEDDRAISGTSVRFALEGTAHDSRVADLSRATDRDGRAETTITAGSVSAAFRVRVSAERAAPAYVNVSVGTEGFGTLQIVAPHVGRREGGLRRVVRVYSATRCQPADGYPTFADRETSLDAPEEAGPRWTLPVGLEYVAVVELLGADGVIIASGCADEISLARDAERIEEVVLSDAPLAPAGQYDVELSLSAGPVVGAAVERGIAAGRAVLGADAATDYLLALEAELRARGLVELADALSQERLEGDLALRLAQALEAGAVGPAEALARLGARLIARASPLRVAGPLTLTPSGDALGARWAAERVEIGAVGDPDGPPTPILEEGELGVPMAPMIELVWEPALDRARVARLALTLRLGTLLGAVLDAWLAGLARPGELLLQGAGCEVLRDFVAIDPTLEPSCDAACAEAACLRVLDGAMEAARATLAAAAGSPDALTLSGTAALVDEDGDLAIERLDAEDLVGTWTGGGVPPAETLAAQLTGRRLE